MATNTTEIKLSGVTSPFDVTRYRNGSQTLYYVSNTASSHISVYNESWGLMYTFGQNGPGAGQFLSVRNIIVSPFNTLWVLDAYDEIHAKVEEFSLKGMFLRYMLTHSDDIYTPTSMYYSDRYLWISTTHNGILQLKKFQVAKDLCP